MIYEEICTYEVCMLAKEKGFDVPTAKNYRHKNGTTCNAPSQNQLQRWLREEKGIQIYIDSDLDFDDETFVYEWQIANKENFDNGGFEIHRYNSEESHSTYELALEDAELYVLKNLV